jgi:threonine dehydrogenase-like Zn-dependent dehydrogenase
MRALTARPGHAGSLTLTEIAAPEPADGDLVVDALAIGVCGTDREIVGGRFGSAPPGRDRLVLGHESLGRVRSAPPGSGFVAGDLVVGMVRRPDPLPCGACAHGEFDMCRNGRYTERGITARDGYGSDTWCVAAEYAIRLDPRLEPVGMLLEPASVVAKAWEQIDRIAARAWSDLRTVLVTGAGPVGLLAALLGVHRGLDVHVLDLATTGPKPRIVADLGATYHAADVGEVLARQRFDVVVEATGAPAAVLAAMGGTAPYGIVCLTGVSSAGDRTGVDVGALNDRFVLGNRVVVGSVNANRRHYAAAADALGRTDLDWLASLVSRRVPVGRYAAALVPHDDDVKVVVTF